MSPEDAPAMPDAVLASMMQQAAPPSQPMQPQHPQQQPAVQGLPMPPVAQRAGGAPPAVQTQQLQHSQRAASMQAQGYGAGSPPGSGASSGLMYAHVHTARVTVDPKVTRGGTLALGMAQVGGRTPRRSHNWAAVAGRHGGAALLGRRASRWLPHHLPLACHTLVAA
jgi:hypothetical protein